jgi:hypothetical protein
MDELTETSRKLNKFARRLRALAARRQAPTEIDIEVFCAIVGIGPVWLTLEKITAPDLPAQDLPAPVN